MNDELLKFIRGARAANVDILDIRAQLIEKGWGAEDVDAHIRVVLNPEAPPLTQKKKAGNPLLFVIAALAIFLAFAYLVGAHGISAPLLLGFAVFIIIGIIVVIVTTKQPSDGTGCIGLVVGIILVISFGYRLFFTEPEWQGYFSRSGVDGLQEELGPPFYTKEDCEAWTKKSLFEERPMFEFRRCGKNCVKEENLVNCESRR